jgi:hypothetical protein
LDTFNEVAQWTVLGLMFVLLLGAFRQIGLMLPGRARDAESGPRIGSRLPREAMALVRKAFPGAHDMDELIVAFVTENCVGCQRLVASVAQSASSDRRRLLFLPREPSRLFVAALEETTIPFAEVTDDEWRRIGVTATPLLLKVNGSGRVLTKEVTSNVDDLEGATA